MKTQLPSTRTGFTLIELMVAMTVGSIVVMGAYYMSQVSSRVFSEQLRRGEAQMVLRSATEQLRRDIVRAGFLSTRNSAELLNCDGSSPPAMGASPGDITPRFIAAAQVMLDANGRQMLYLTGNLSTVDQYWANTNLSNAGSLVLQDTKEGFRRSFVNPTTGVYIPASFAEAFTSDGTGTLLGRMVSITDLDSMRIYLRDVSGVTANAATITLGTPLDLNAGNVGPCMNLNNAGIAPVMMVRYAIENVSAAPELAKLAGWTVAGGVMGAEPRLALVRREINLTSPTLAPIPGTERVVLDSPDARAGFVLHAVVERTRGVLTYEALPETLTPAPLTGTIRSLIVELMVRTEAAEGSAATSEMARRALAAMRFTRFEVMLPNALRNVGAP